MSKKSFTITLLIATCLFMGLMVAVFGQDAATKASLPFKLTLSEILALVVGVYEVIVRVIPTVGNLSFLGKIIDILKWLSDFFNRKKKVINK